MLHRLDIATVSPGFSHSLAIATSRAGGVPILDFEYARDQAAVAAAIQQLNDSVRTPFAAKFSADTPDLLSGLIGDLPDRLRTVIILSHSPEELHEVIRLLHQRKITALLEATCVEQAKSGEAAGFDGVIAKGHEAGGRIGDETTFVLVQRFRAHINLPVWAHGGIGLHTAAACMVAGCAGLILDSQLALTRESPLSELVKSKISSMDGSETICLGEQLGEAYRMYFRPGNRVVKELQELEARLATDERKPPEVLTEWRQAIFERVGSDPDRHVLLLGQDAAFAASLAKRFRTVGGVLQGIREAIQSHCQAAERLRPLAEASSLAVSHNTRFPILQGPMTRVSDVPEFAARVAEGGGLPFLALALMRAPEVETLLAGTKKRLGTMPWGVGILGFVPPELRQEQLEVIHQYRPPFALIAGGRPDQARSLEQQGIPTYLHVPSPGLLQMFVQQGARRFVFEGRECGGHVGPRTSFVLWNQMVNVLLESPELEANPQDFHVVFAAGIHDALSSAMVSAIAAPLAEKGVRVGALLGTAYLFTEEAVASGAILRTFQEQAQQCRRTVLLESGPGHSTRCVDTPYAAAFAREKRRLVSAGLSAEDQRLELEKLNLGRLRIASKGTTRNASFGQDPTAAKLLEIDEKEQVAQGMYMIGQVAALRERVCTIEELHRNVSVEGSKTLAGLADFSWEVPARGREVASDVAIVGMACLLPKAPDLRTFWENIVRKVDAVTEVPQDRWDSEMYFNADPKAKDKIYSRWGGFLDAIPFDPTRYGMPPASLRSIEPAQLLTLEVVRAALEDAGYLDRPFARERTSVILGAGGGAADLGLGYGARSFIPVLEDLPEFRGRSGEILELLGDRLPEWTEDSFAGILTNVAAGRVANRFNLGGSNYTVDAACASSLAAVSLALKELEGDTSDMVIVGGMDTMQNPFTYLCFSKTHALSPRGRCRTFDESADGIAISEGIAVMVFKRLEDAERDGDRIYAVIKSAGSSSDGKDRGLTAPRPEGQARALKRAYAKAGISPSTVGLIEAHGTGTVAGDNAEVQALTQVFSEAQTRKQSCAIGSVKSMIGHTKCSAGAAGLIKAALALHHKVLPATLGVEKPNPRANFPETPFFVNTETRPWLDGSSNHPRRAGVSAFGFGGTNFHVVLEEYTGDPVGAQAAPCLQWSDELFVFRADSRQAMLETVQLWEKSLPADAKPELRDLAYTAWKLAEAKTGSGESRLSLAIVANSVDDLRQKLATASQSLAQPATARIHDPRGIYFSAQPLSAQGKLAFLFPGQGSQYPCMLQDLFLHFPEMRNVFERAVRVLSDKLDQPLSSYVFPPPAFSPDEEQKRQRALTQTNIAQPALGAVNLAMYGLLQEFGLQPDMAAGHSYGEYVALAAAGAFKPEGLIALSEARGRFIVEAAGAEPGAMAAIEADAAVVADVVKNFDGVCLANANAPRQTVISGERAALERAVAQFASQGTTARMIPVACAFHSPLVEPAQARLAEFLAAVEVSEPDIPVYSNTTAEPYPTEPQAVKQRLVEHLVRPVEFVREIEAMYEAGARVFIEVGPRGVLTSLVDQILGDRPKLAAASNQNGRPGLVQLLHVLGQLAAQGYALKLDRLYRDRSTRRLDLSALRGSPEKPLGAAVWMVNGARATPLKQISPKSLPKPASNGHAAMFEPAPAKSATPLPAAALPAPAASPGVSRGPAIAAPAPSMASTPIPAAPTIPAPAPMASAPVAAEGTEQVVMQFHQTMCRIVDAQKAIMLAYLGNMTGAAAIAPAAIDPAHEAAPQPVKQEPALASQPHPAASAASAAPVVPEPPSAQEPISVVPGPDKAGSGPDKQKLTAALLSIVSERTGYPPEMLALNLDLEADLGIDSIKRVEILGTFQQSFAAAGMGAAEGLMEKLSGVKTLSGIIDCITASSAASAGDAAQAPPQSRPAATGFDRAKLSTELLSIVSERTGYPPEMLALNLDLEADLGIDSIKRVEILGTLQQSFTAAGVALNEGLMEKLTGVRTLDGIMDRVCEHLAGAGEPGPAIVHKPTAAADAKPVEPLVAASGPVEPAAPAEPLPVESGPEEIRRYTLTVVDTPLAGRSKKIAKDRPILVSCGGHPVARSLVNELLGCGYQVAAVRHGRAVQELEPGSYAADLGSPESVTELIALVSQRQGPLGGIVHLLPLEGEASFAAHEYDGWKAQLGFGVKSLFHLTKAAAKPLRDAGKGGAGVIAATAMGGSFLAALPAENPAAFPDHGAIAGLMKTLALEWPEVGIKTVDLDPQERADALARHLLEEVHAADTLVEVGYHAGRRVTLQPTDTPLDTGTSANIALDRSAVVLITGGARGITARAARHLAELCQPKLVLAGRSPSPPAEEAAATAGLSTPKELKAALMDQMRARGETVTPALVERAYARLTAEREIRSNLAALRQLGAEVHYHSVDVRDGEAFGKFIDGIYTSFGRLDAVIHGAGLIEDKLIQDKTPESFDRVFNTKVDSAFVLSRKLRPESLRYLVFFSSVSGRFGNRGQGDYAAANEVLNKLAVCLDRAWPSRVVAINWGPWDTEGMVSAEVRKQFAERGVKLIPAATGLRRLEEEMKYGRRGEAEVVIGGAGWQVSAPPEIAHGYWPLVRQNGFTRSGESMEVLREIDLSYDLYLNDHRLDGQPVMPLAIATELMGEAVAQNWPGMQVVSLRKLRLLHGVVIDNGSKPLRIVAKPQAGNGSDPTRVAVEVTGPGKSQRIHYRATIELAGQLPAAPPLNIPPLPDGRAFTMDLADLYRRWLFHGPLFQGISRVDLVAPGGIKAMLATSSPAGWVAETSPGQWLIDPLMFDSALQLLVLWAREHWDMTALPSGFESYRRFAAPTAGRVLCELRLRPETVQPTIHADIFFLDAATGGVLGMVEDMQGTCSRALNRLAGEHVMAAGNQS